MTTELVERPATPASLVQREGNGVIGLAMMTDRDFESRLAALKLGQERVRRIQREMMTVDEDYGVIPGTPKPTLLKPGAEKICQVYGLVPAFDETLVVGDGLTTPHLRVKTKCELHVGSKDGPVVGEGIGAANSWERKHRYRGGLRSCPKCGVEGSIRRSKFDDKGWYCHDKAGGCGEQFRAEDPQILEQHAGQVENPDPFDVENTLFKMAEKRAHVDAVLRATATSGLFTQDVEDSGGESVAVAPAKPVGASSTSAVTSAQTLAAQPTGHTTVTDVATRTGTNARGAWTLYTVTFADGRKGTTFHDSLAKHAEHAKASGALVNPKLDKTDKGWTLAKFDEIAKPVPVAVAQEPDEPVSGPEMILTVRKVETDAGPRWVIQTSQRQVVTDLSGLADTAHAARANKVGLIPIFEVVPRTQGGTVNKLTEWKSAPTAEREPGSDDR